jgi:hypothetical protein
MARDTEGAAGAATGAAGATGTETVVTTAAWLDLAGQEPRMIAADLVHRASDCLAATLVLRGPDGTEVPWTFAWELLAQGLTGPAGEGDVRIRPVRGVAELVEIAFGPGLSARVRLLARDALRFAEQVRRVAPGAEARVAASLEAELAVITERAEP